MSKWLIVLPPEGAARTTGEQLIPAFQKKLGKDDVIIFDCLNYLTGYEKLLKNPENELIVDLLNQSLIVKCLDSQATHLLVLALSPVTMFALDLIKKQGVINIHWFYEDYRRVDYWKYEITGYNYFFGIQKGALMDLCRRCNVFFHYLPTAALNSNNLEIFKFKEKSDLVFVGIPSSYRIFVLEKLAAAGRTMIIAGSHWDTYEGPLFRFIYKSSWVRPQQLPGIYARAKIGLNLSFNDPSNDRENAQISPRVFDVLQSDLVLITEETSLIHETLPELEFHTFKDMEGLSAAVNEALLNYDSYKTVFDANRKIIAAKHQYENRVLEILDIMRK